MPQQVGMVSHSKWMVGRMYSLPPVITTISGLDDFVKTYRKNLAKTYRKECSNDWRPLGGLKHTLSQLLTPDSLVGQRKVALENTI